MCHLSPVTCHMSRAPADREASIKDSGFTRPGSGVTVLCLHCTVPTDQEEAPLPGRDSMGREQREIPGLVWEWLAGTRSGACWAETNQSKSRERFPVLFGLNEHDQELE